MIVRDERPLSLIGNKLAEYKQHLQWLQDHKPKHHAWLLAAVWVLVAALGVVAVSLGLSESEPPPPEPSETTGIGQALANLWNNIVWPVMGAPLTAWAHTHLDVPGITPHVGMWVWLAFGVFFLFAIGDRSIYPRIAWAGFGAATVAMGYTGAAPQHAIATSGVLAMVWAVLSLAAYKRAPKPLVRIDPLPTRTESLAEKVERNKRLLDAAEPGSYAYNRLRRHIDDDLSILVGWENTDREDEKALRAARRRAEPRREQAGMVLGSLVIPALGWIVAATGSPVWGSVLYLLGSLATGFLVMIVPAHSTEDELDLAADTPTPVR